MSWARGCRLGVLMYGERKSSSLVLALCCARGEGEGGSPLRVHQDKVEIGASAPCFQQLGPLLSLPFKVLAVGLGRCKRFL